LHIDENIYKKAKEDGDLHAYIQDAVYNKNIPESLKKLSKKATEI